MSPCLGKAGGIISREIRRCEAIFKVQSKGISDEWLTFQHSGALTSPQVLIKISQTI